MILIQRGSQRKIVLLWWSKSNSTVANQRPLKNSIFSSVSLILLNLNESSESRPEAYADTQLVGFTRIIRMLKVQIYLLAHTNSY